MAVFGRSGCATPWAVFLGASYLASRLVHSVLPPKARPAPVHAHGQSQVISMVTGGEPNASAKPHSRTGLWPGQDTLQLPGGKLVVH